MSVMSWSQQQKAIFQFFQNGTGNCVIEARAGSGKTTTLLEGVTLAPEDRILVAAFNKAIERELSARLKKKGAYNVTAKTLHGLGYSILCKEIPGFKMDKDLPWAQRRSRKLSESAIAKVTKKGRPGKDIISLVSKILDRARLSMPFATCGDELVDIAYAGGHLPNGFQKSNGWDVATLCECAHTALELAKDTSNITHIDFNDMIFLPVVKGWGRPTYDMVCIDEAQDMTLVQLQLAQSVAKKNARIVVVGDACQAIYGFRGADSKSLSRLRKKLKATSLSLTTTYRCATTIVEEAQRLVPDIQACDTAKEGKVDSVRIDNLPKEVKAGDFVLSRSNAPLMKTCLSFIREGIPAKIQGKEFGKQLSTTISIVSDKLESMSTKEFMGRLAEWKNDEVAKAIAAEAEGRADLIADQAATIEVLSEGCESVADLFGKIDKLFGDPAKEHGFVVCSTVHKAKGLEADTVFMLVDTFYPGNPRGPRLTEEQNLEYVAITRAQNRLVRVS